MCRGGCASELNVHVPIFHRPITPAAVVLKSVCVKPSVRERALIIVSSTQPITNHVSPRKLHRYEHSCFWYLAKGGRLELLEGEHVVGAAVRLKLDVRRLRVLLSDLRLRLAHLFAENHTQEAKKTNVNMYRTTPTIEKTPMRQLVRGLGRGVEGDGTATTTGMA